METIRIQTASCLLIGKMIEDDDQMSRDYYDSCKMKRNIESGDAGNFINFTE